MQRITFGQILERSLALIARHGLALSLYTIGLALAQTGLEALSDGTWGGLANTIIGFVVGYFLLLHVLTREGLMRQGRGQTRFASYLGAMILTGIATVLGFLLFIIPGLIFIARWSIAGGLIIADGQSTAQGMAQSWEATRESQWSIVGFFAVVFVLFIMIVGGVAAVVGVFLTSSAGGGATGFIAALATNAVAQFASAASSCCVVAIQQQLRPGQDGLEQVFS